MPYASVLTTYEPPGALAWSPVARPEPGTGQIRICGHAAGVSPADPKIRRGEPRQVFPPPAALSFETRRHGIAGPVAHADHVGDDGCPRRRAFPGSAGQVASVRAGCGRGPRVLR
jgi:NADPH:quinone reductase-like Zn-dependent oxidoreductase